LELSAGTTGPIHAFTVPPRAIELRVSTRDTGELRRIVELPSSTATVAPPGNGNKMGTTP
jgi:hypothetical protein